MLILFIEKCPSFINFFLLTLLWHLFAGPQEHCSTVKCKDNEEIWKMGKTGNSSEVSLAKPFLFWIN
jgi:hypothetical protein